ncbi:MAG TPA: hypothetical protein VNN76_01995 [Bacteroidota bacterium]|nr:hypothetical protein [Bacteroidota bacterium]
MKCSQFVLLLLIPLPSCELGHQQGSELSTEYLVFGRFAGECTGEQCIEIFKIEHGALYEDTLDRYPTGLHNGVYRRLSESMYTRARPLVHLLPREITKLPDGRIGAPDSHDQSGIYLELKRDAVRHYWLIDTEKGRIPAFLHAFVDSLQRTVEALSTALPFSHED